MKIEFSAPLHRILCDKYGFLMFSSSPSEKEKEEYLKVCELLNREDLPFTPHVPVVYERKLSNITSLFIKGAVNFTDTGLPLGYRYDFYKARYIDKNYPQEIKVYCKQVTRKILLQKLKQFSFLEKEDLNV
ncbi:hypothetical protein ACOU9P_002580 [Enterococcus faecium]|uniref:hypothetical protein n=1 Tax=Enterococcus faecium TaxID=1352 RepID=UPI00100F2465|nr:hypothetical protein [Enterococcus faecium]MDW3672318.1 hypothetical protein [Enterococcus faecium]RXW76517.1 hypothetical protein CYQ67_09020 [Enterococcus faecium]TKN48901.1 hypothetical protein DVW96_07465 [Enterococcus faecium]TKN96964.1 hypothetical protein DVX31_07590 [Enterococcus faecium]TKQ80501.1 hypothetical protein DV480_08380 [Enterococcus faecium]